MFHAPTIEPCPEMLSPLRGVLAALRNPLEGWSEPFFEKSLHVTSFMGRTFLTVIDPELTKEILVARSLEFRKSPFIEKILCPALGDGLLTAAEDSWRYQRCAIEPVFSFERIKDYTPDFERPAVDIARRLLPDCLGGRIDVLPIVEEEVRDMALRTLLGGLVSDQERKLINHEASICAASLGYIDILDIAGAPDWLPRPWRLRGYAAARNLRRIARQIIDRRTENARESNGLLHSLLLAKVQDPFGLTDEQLVDNVLTLISAGMETTPMAIVWTLSILAHLPDLQQRLAEEANTILTDGPTTAEKLTCLELHRRVVAEAMRLYPPVASIGLSPVTECKIAGTHLKPGDHITIGIYLLHRHKHLWENPSAFDPDRFAPEASRNRHRFAYLPFGRGQRMCVGMGLAQLEIFAVLATLLRRLRFAPDPTHRVRPVARIALRPEGGMPLYVSPRV